MKDINIIQGQKFQQIKAENIFYSHTHDANHFLRNLKYDKPFIFITHNSDGKVVDNGFNFPHASLSNAPKNLIKWFGQSIKVEDSRVTSIPIGLENDYIKNANEKIKYVKENLFKKTPLKNFVYLNHNIHTNIGERNPIYLKFHDKKFVTTEYPSYDYLNYFKNLSSHLFVFSPDGNSIDCHRTWEALYCGCIPIVKRSINSSFYKDLPLCFVDNWSDVTEGFLINEFERIRNSDFNLDKLDFNYWENLIKKEAECIL
jgi:hypothetical protein